MARRKQRVETSEINAVSGVGRAWPSAPKNSNRYVLYCRNYENERIWVVGSFGLYAAKKLFDAVVEDGEIEVKGNTAVIGDIDVRSDQLKEIMDYEYTEAEAAWELPTPYCDDAERFLRAGKPDERTDEERRDAKKSEAARPGRAVRLEKAKIDKTGLISVQTICEELGCEPRDGRGVLRKEKIEKPAGGWLFTKERAAEIKAIIKKGLK